MTLTTSIQSGPTLTKTEPTPPKTSYHDDSKIHHNFSQQGSASEKKLHEYTLEIVENCFTSLSIEDFLGSLPEAFQAEIQEIKKHCTSDKNLIRILNGEGPFYNRLIILLIKIDCIISQKKGLFEEKINLEKKFNLYLTDGKINLKDKLGHQLNHLNNDWLADPVDWHHFSDDYLNREIQIARDDFFPRWMEDVTIGKKTISSITFEYWELRHSVRNRCRKKLEDQRIQSFDPDLYQCLLEMRRIKMEAEKSTEIPSQLSLSKLQIAAIDQRLCFADIKANKIRGFQDYYWMTGAIKDKQTPSAPRKARKKSPPIEQALPTQHTTLSNHIVKTLSPEADLDPRTEGSRRSSRKHKPNARYTSEDEAPITKKLKASSELEKTRIPKLVSSLKDFLECEIEISKDEVPLADEVTSHKMVIILSALDQLSRLHNACKLQFERPELIYGSERSSDAFTNTYESIFEDQEEEVSESDYQHLVASIPKHQVFKPEKEKQPIPTETIDQTQYQAKLDIAKTNLKDLITEARRLLFSTEALNLTLSRPDDVQGWQSLETLINFPLYSLDLSLGFKMMPDYDKEELLSKRSQLFTRIREEIEYCEDKLEVWDDTHAQKILNSHWEELMTIQSQLYALKDWALMALPAPITRTDEVQIIEEEIRKNIRVLSYLTSLSLRLRTERHQELFEKLSEAIS
ncbi:hypothetical protein [Endozoicomonas atrinae]|uniref:hypothetical protein n=1 Tax=Endozoicomonas atrinae TaxID=1333660 RepID=UPI003B006F94